MNPASDIAGVCERARSLAEPLVRQAGLNVFDVEYKPAQGRMVLRVYLQRPGGAVTLDELTAMSRQLGDVFEAHEAIPGRYSLECSSPGLERLLRREEHYRGALGERVSVRVRDAVADRRLLKGTLVGVSEGAVSVDDPEVGRVDIPFALISEARTEFAPIRKGAPGARS